MGGIEVGKMSRMQGAVRALLKALGEDPNRGGLKDTPERVAKAWLEMTEGYREDASAVVGRAVFQESELPSDNSGIVCVRDIELASTSEENLLPFYGHCHIAYAPSGGAVLGLSKLARLVNVYAKRIQTQERLTWQLVEAIEREVAPRGIAVVIEARHLGWGDDLAPVVTSRSTGVFETSERARQELRAVFLLNGSLLPQFHSQAPPAQSIQRKERCTPSQKDSAHLVQQASMGLAMHQLLSELGIQEQSKGLERGIQHYLQHLVRATAGYSKALPVASPRTSRDQDTAETTTTSSEDCTSDCQDMNLNAPPHIAIPPNPSTSTSSEDCSDENGVDRELRPVAGSTESLYDSGMDTEDVSDMGDCSLQYVRWRFSRAAWSLGLAGFMTPDMPVPCGLAVCDGCFLFQSNCEHHLLPFQGCVYVGYLPRSRKLTQGQLGSIVEMFSLRLQLQERITNQIADAVQKLVDPIGLVVMGQAVHMCMVARGVKSHASKTVNTVTRGKVDAVLFEQGIKALNEKFALLEGSRDGPYSS